MQNALVASVGVVVGRLWWLLSDRLTVELWLSRRLYGALVTVVSCRVSFHFV